MLLLGSKPSITSHHPWHKSWNLYHDSTVRSKQVIVSWLSSIHFSLSIFASLLFLSIQVCSYLRPQSLFWNDLLQTLKWLGPHFIQWKCHLPWVDFLDHLAYQQSLTIFFRQCIIVLPLIISKWNYTIYIFLVPFMSPQLESKLHMVRNVCLIQYYIPSDKNSAGHIEFNIYLIYTCGMKKNWSYFGKF